MTLQAKSQVTKANLVFGLEKFMFWQRWLLIVGLILADIGLYMIFLKGTPYFALMDSLVNPVFWASPMAPANVTGFQGYVYGEWGTAVAVWGISLACIAHYAFKQKEKWAWNWVLVTTLLWYFASAFVSFQVHFALNVAANTVVLLLLILPLLFTRKDFSTKS